MTPSVTDGRTKGRSTSAGTRNPMRKKKGGAGGAEPSRRRRREGKRASAGGPGLTQRSNEQPGPPALSLHTRCSHPVVTRHLATSTVATRPRVVATSVHSFPPALRRARYRSGLPCGTTGGPGTCVRYRGLLSITTTHATTAVPVTRPTGQRVTRPAATCSSAGSGCCRPCSRHPGNGS
ncbi:hypothetical protein G1C97_0515 [Bifidobacterium sp. DSM 109959]|uniref:Uncharacterized protein n=1 Tax=Bifidobacterium olomucense TaxID=2675324 RepID=A0A7Y0EW80_9BIFI|nr:hypothetical protein [Bifidobacterium sp. DSM 109959]